MRRRRISPPVRWRLRRSAVLRAPTVTRSLVRLRRVLAPRAATEAPPGDRSDGLWPVLGKPVPSYLLAAIALRPMDDDLLRSMRANRAHVTLIDPSDIADVQPGAFDAAIVPSSTVITTELLDALLDHVRVVITEAPPPTSHVASRIEGVHLVHRPADLTVVDGVPFRPTSTVIRKGSGRALRDRRRYESSIHPETGERVFVKSFDTTGPDGRTQRRLLRSEARIHTALQRGATPSRHFPRLVAAEWGRRGGALVFAHLDLPTLADPSLVLSVCEGRRVLREVSTAVVELLERTGRHHPDLNPSNVGVGEPCVLFDLEDCTRRPRDPFDRRLSRITAAIRERLVLEERSEWDSFVATLPITGPHELLAHLEQPERP